MVRWDQNRPFCNRRQRWVWRSKEESHTEKHSITTVKFGGGYLMLWGVFLPKALDISTPQNHPKIGSVITKQRFYHGLPGTCLNPIKHLWDVLKRRVQKSQSQNQEELKVFWTEEWSQIPDCVSSDLITHFRRRLGAVTVEAAQNIKCRGANNCGTHILGTFFCSILTR